MSDAAVQIRDARLDERAAIEQLTLAAYQQYATIMAPSAWAALSRALSSALNAAFAPDAAVERIVAEQRGALVGSVLLYPAASNAYSGALAGLSAPELRLLAVAPAARGQGIGRALLQACVRRARAAGASALGLHTSESMRVAVAMYERMGFVRDPEQDFRPEGAEVVWAYRLSLDNAG